MPPKRNYKRLIAAVIFVLLILAALLIPIEVPYSINTHCKIIPVKEWTVEKNSEGGITISLYDHKNGSTETSSFDAKSIGGFKLYKPQGNNGDVIKYGDTVGYIETVKQPSSFKAEDKHLIISPISGALSNRMNDTLLMSVRDVSAFLVLIPVKLNEKNYVNVEQKIEVKVPGTKNPFEGKILKVGDDFQVISGKQYMVSVGEVNALTKEIQPGIVANCTIECKPVRIYEYISRAMNSNINEQ